MMSRLKLTALRAFPVLLLGTLVSPVPEPAVQAELMLEGASTASCDTAESCFRSALEMEPRSVTGVVDEGLMGHKMERLRLVMERYPGSVWARRAMLTAGVWWRERDPGQALELLEDAEEYLPVLGDYVRFWRAEALAHLNEPVKAATLFESIAREDPGTLLKARAAYRGGALWYRTGDCPEAIVQLGRALALDPRDEAAPRALLNLADCELREIETADGHASLRRVWTDYPAAPEAEVALARLHTRAETGVWQPEPETLYQRAQVLLDQALYVQAADTLQELLQRAPEHPARDEVWYNRGLAYIRLKRYEEVRPIFEALVDGKGPVAGKAAVWLAKVYIRSGTGSELLRFVERLAELPLSPMQRASIYLTTGVWLEEEGKTDHAMAMYRRAAEAGSGTHLAPKAHWQTGWLLYRTGRIHDAAEAFHLGAKSGAEHGWTPQFLYWLGRAFERERDARAAEVHARLCREYPLTYYGMLVTSCGRTAETGPAGPERTDESDAATQVDVPARLRDDVHYQKAKELLEMAFKEEAARELTWLARQPLGNRRALLELSARLSEAEAHHEALRVAKIYFRDVLEGGRPSAESGLWRVAYPTGYLPIIQSHVAESVDPYLVAALIREESLYDTNALSPAGAVGLMQLMPATARRLGGQAEDLNALRQQLFDSNTNIRFGSQYLGMLVRQFSGNLLHAVAAYNAGPAAVSSWVSRNGAANPEEFVELIPYRETRGYVKRVLRSYREYHRLQNGGCAASSLDKVC